MSICTLVFILLLPIMFIPSIIEYCLSTDELTAMGIHRENIYH